MPRPYLGGLDQVSRATRGAQILRGTLAATEAALTTPLIGSDLDTAQHVWTC